MSRSWQKHFSVTIQHLAENHTNQCFCGAALPPFDARQIDAEVTCTACGQTYRLRMTIDFLANDVWDVRWGDDGRSVTRRAFPPETAWHHTVFHLQVGDGSEKLVYASYRCAECSKLMKLDLLRSLDRSKEKAQVVAIYHCVACGHDRTRTLPKRLGMPNWASWLLEQMRVEELKAKGAPGTEQ